MQIIREGKGEELREGPGKVKRGAQENISRQRARFETLGGWKGRKITQKIQFFFKFFF